MRTFKVGGESIGGYKDDPALDVSVAPRTRRGRPLDIERAAWHLVRRYGDDCAAVAYARASTCAQHGDDRRAAEWRLVLERSVALQFAEPGGAPH